MPHPSPRPWMIGPHRNPKTRRLPGEWLPDLRRGNDQRVDREQDECLGDAEQHAGQQEQEDGGIHPHIPPETPAFASGVFVHLVYPFPVRPGTAPTLYLYTTFVRPPRFLAYSIGVARWPRTGRSVRISPVRSGAASPHGQWPEGQVCPHSQPLMRCADRLLLQEFPRLYDDDCLLLHFVNVRGLRAERQDIRRAFVEGEDL